MDHLRQKMQKDALECVCVCVLKLKVGEVQTGILFPALKTYPIWMTFFVLWGNKEILIKSRLSLLEHGLWWDELFCWTVYSKGFTSVNIAYDYAEHVRVEKNSIWLKAVPGTFLPCILKMSFLTCSSYRSVVSQLLWSWESHNVKVTVVAYRAGGMHGADHSTHALIASKNLNLNFKHAPGAFDS